MDPFTTLTAVAAPMPMQNIDTDKIIPARFLKTIKRSGLGVHLFDPLRFDKNGNEKPDFVLNQEPFRRAQVIIAHENFGCGSSREHAPWALVGWGLRAIVAPSFADIFKQNSMKNGLLPVAVDAAFHARLVEARRAHPGARIAVDLPAQTVALEGQGPVRFEIDPFAKECLVHGVDELGYLLERASDIERYEAQHP